MMVWRQALHVGAVDETVADSSEETLIIGAAKVGAALELGEWVGVGAHAVVDDVLLGVEIKLAGQVGVDAEEFFAFLALEGRCIDGLLLERGEKSLEPLERGRVSSRPDELDSS